MGYTDYIPCRDLTQIPLQFCYSENKTQPHKKDRMGILSLWVPMRYPL